MSGSISFPFHLKSHHWFLGESWIPSVDVEHTLWHVKQSCMCVCKIECRIHWWTGHALYFTTHTRTIEYWVHDSQKPQLIVVRRLSLYTNTSSGYRMKQPQSSSIYSGGVNTYSLIPRLLLSCKHWMHENWHTSWFSCVHVLCEKGAWDEPRVNSAYCTSHLLRWMWSDWILCYVYRCQAVIHARWSTDLPVARVAAVSGPEAVR